MPTTRTQGVAGPICVRLLSVLILSLVGSACVATSAGWEATRKKVIDPINSELHRHLPSFVKRRDLDAIMELYATNTGTGLTWEEPRPVNLDGEEQTLRWEQSRGAEPIRERYRRLFALFSSVERADLRIHRVLWTEPDDKGLPAQIRLIVRGMCADGASCQLDQRATISILQFGERWRIVREEVTARELVRRDRPRYQVVTDLAGIRNVHTNEGSPRFRLIGDTTSSAGSAVADIDRDGWEDLFLAGSPGAALYRNNRDGTFTDVTIASGLPHPFPVPATGVVFFDYDNDGWPDLYACAVAGGDRLFRNHRGRFMEVTGKAGIPAGQWASMATVADYDRDGFLDVYLIRMGDHEKSAPRPNYQANNGVPNTLLHNNGDGTFTDVTEGAGVGDKGWGLAGAWGDYDEDGWPDIYVANEFGFNALYRNNRDGTFTDRAHQAGAADRAAGMGVAWGDYDNDGHLDIFVSNMYANSRWALFHPDFPVPVPMLFQLLGYLTPEVQRRSDQIMEEVTRGSTLLRNNGDGTFTDVTDNAGVRDGQWGWSTEFLDYDNDGDLDIYAVNGFVTGPIEDDV